MDEIMGCLCDTEFAGLAGNDDISERIEIKENRIWQNPVNELENYYQNPRCYEHAEIEGETVLAGVEGRTIDLTVTLEDGENTIFSIKLAADSEYETSYTYNKETRLLEIDRTYCGVTKDVVCVRKFRIEDPAGLKKMRFILDYHSIELLSMMDSRRRPLQSVRL